MTDAAAQAQPAAPQQAQGETPPVKPLTRREFLYYLWGISMAVYLAGSAGATLWFALPRFREGEFGGVFTLDPGVVPPPDSGPKPFSEGRFWLVNQGPRSVSDPRERKDLYPRQEGVKALYMVCVHLGCLYKWVPSNDRFECPCHGSKFLKTGTRLEGPAARNLDVFVVEAVDAQGNVLARTEPELDGGEGTAIQLPPGTVALRVDTGKRIQGAPNTI